MDKKSFRIDLPTETHRKLKVLAANHGVTMREIVVDLITAKLAAEQQRETRP